MYSNDTPIAEQISSVDTNLAICPEPQGQELYIQIRDGVADQIIKHGLNRTESKLFFYLLKLDRFGDRPVKIKVAKILIGTGIGKTAYHKAVTKFQTMGWFDFTHSDVQVTNFCTPTKLSAKTNSDFCTPTKLSAKTNSQSAKTNSQSAKTNSQSAKTNSEKLKALPDKSSKTSQTIQTYSNLPQTLSEEMRESFEKFCKNKIKESSFKIVSREAWLEKYGAEYLEEFKETYSDALERNLEPTKTSKIDRPSIATLKQQYPNWKDAAVHHGYTDEEIALNSPMVENEDLGW